MFQTALKAWFRTQDDTSKELVLKLRLWYFLFELGRHVTQIDVENALLKKHMKFENFEKAFEEWHNKQGNQTPLWTRESFSHWFNDFVVRGYEERKKRENKSA